MAWDTNTSDPDYDPTDPTNYNIDHIYRRSSNKFGVGQTVKVIKMPASAVGAIASLIQSHPELGFKTQQDFQRDAQVHRLHYLQERLKNDPDAYAKIGTALAEFKLDNLKARAESLEETYQQINQLWMGSSTSEKRRQLVRETVQSIIDGLEPEFQDWKPKFLQMIG